MLARITAAFWLMMSLTSLTFAADKNPTAAESISVKVVGTLGTGVDAIGIETTGTTITARGTTWELGFGKNTSFRKVAEKLIGKIVVVQGSLERRSGVEIKERWIVRGMELEVRDVGVDEDQEASSVDATVGEKELIASDHPAHVRAKVLYGSRPRNEQVADIELWISEAVAKAGAPLALPYTNWLTLEAKEQEVYSSMQGGRIVKATASEKDGMFHVEINGLKIKPLKQTILLKPGERRVVKLTDYPAQNNVFIALEALGIEKAK